MGENGTAVAGIDVGTECIKVIVLKSDGTVLGRSVVPVRGYFQDRVREAMSAALDEARLQAADLAGTCATGFGKGRVPDAMLIRGDAACHAAGAFHYFPQAVTVVDIGGRDPKVIHVDDTGRPTEIHTLRRCAAGIGSFLMFASRHLDVHPTRLQELADSVDTPAAIGSYCSVFAGSEVLERLYEGASREEVARGCIHSVAERVVEIGYFAEPVKVTGGVAEYFPGVLKSLAEITDLKVEAVPEPITAGALGAALEVLRAVQGGGGD